MTGEFPAQTASNAEKVSDWTYLTHLGLVAHIRVIENSPSLYSDIYSIHECRNSLIAPPLKKKKKNQQKTTTKKQSQDKVS